jgi:hypothetical protein
MEAVALASTFATLIGFAMQLYSNCKYYVDAAKGDCPSDLRLIMIESSSLEAILRVIKELVALGAMERGEETQLERQVAKPIADCEACIRDLLKLVPKPMIKEGNGTLTKTDKVRIVLNALAWGVAGKKSTCDTLLRSLRSHKATLTLGLTTEMSYDVKKMAADVAEVKSTVSAMHASLNRE